MNNNLKTARSLLAATVAVILLLGIPVGWWILAARAEYGNQVYQISKNNGVRIAWCYAPPGTTEREAAEAAAVFEDPVSNPALRDYSLKVIRNDLFVVVVFSRKSRLGLFQGLKSPEDVVVVMDRKSKDYHIMYGDSYGRKPETVD